MIIRFPTGLYRSALPGKPQDDQSVTFLISSSDPPRSVEAFTEVPLAVELQEKPPILNELGRRDWYGDLLYTIDQSLQSITGSLKKSFEVGQILGFDQEVSSAALTQSQVRTDIRHDTNVLDLESTGLSDVEIDELVKASERRKQELDQELTFLISQLENTKILIGENQKSINEVQKTISAAEVALMGSAGSSATGSPILDKLEAQLKRLEAGKADLISQLSSIDNQAQIVRDELLDVSQLVR